MAIRLKIPKSKGRLSDPVIRGAVATFIILCTLLFGVFSYYYVRYEKIVDRRMRGQIFANTAKIFSGPRVIRTGDKWEAGEIAGYLRRAGYTEYGEHGESKLGTYRQLGGGIEIRPGPESFHAPEPTLVKISDGKVKSIAAVGGGSGSLSSVELEPQLVTGLFTGVDREKRRLVTFDDMPKVLVDAVTSVEDQQFFNHSGINYWRFLQSAYINFTSGRKAQGGSTITMQIARGFFLSPEKTYKRKATEMLIAFQLEQRFSKKQIFELYANQVPMGQRGSFAISGFGEAAQAYFGKDVRELTLPEASLLAGMIQRPSWLSPYKHPERALERRNVVLHLMQNTGKITREEAERAKAAPLKLAPPNVEASDAPYFVDLVKDQLQQRYSEDDLNDSGYRVYTTIDPDLQKAAADSIDAGLKEVDQLLLKRRTRKTGKGKAAQTKILPGPEAQVALVCIDPHTGEVLALVGGRNYGQSQLNRVLAKRPTGSIFKPFVYAAAMNTALDDSLVKFTPASTLLDNQTTFVYEDTKTYDPRNYKGEYHGEVSARKALTLSLNNATVWLAEQIGYDRVASLARAAGIKSVRPTPAMALGAYDATPLEMAGAYTVFANDGTYITPLMLSSVRDAQGNVIDNFSTEQKQILDPRIAYVMTTMMESVINNGTGATVRARGFSLPAAGKTGSSHDAWFAGYTSNLLTIVWVGFDDYTDIKMAGGAAAAPIWAEFMKRATALPQYARTADFKQPEGVVDVRLDKVTNRIANDSCPDAYTIAFVSGTEPQQTCDQPLVTQQAGFWDRLFGKSPKPSGPGMVSNLPQQQPALGQPQAAPQAQGTQQQQPEPEKKKGIFGRIFGALKGSDEKDDKDKQQPSTETNARPAQPATRPKAQ